MPVGFNSPARNLFLFGTSGEQVVQNFFKNVDLSGSNDKCFRPSDIRLAANGDYFIAGTSQDNTSADNGFVDRRSFDAETSIETLVSQFGVSSSQVNVSTTLTALEVDSNFKLILCGKTGGVPWVGRFSDTGVADWISTSNTADVEYSGIAFDSNGIYLCGHTPTASGESYAVVEKYDLNGSPLWGKTIRSFGDDAEIERVDVNTRGELIAVGKIADNTKNKGYISKIDTSTGEILWSRTLEHGNKTGSFYDSVFCTDVHIDENDEIFISGNIVRGASVRGFYVKYSAEGNMILQRENGADQFSTTTDIYSDGLTGQTTIGGTYITTGGDYRATISKYSRQGVLLWRRYYRTDDGGGEVRLPNFHAEGAFYYVTFNDDAFDSNNLTPNSYLYGKVSSSGNGLGGFVYDAQDSKFIDYEITTDISNELGKLSDGSVRNDTSDFISYPYSGNRIAFDDLATVIANKKVQVDDVGIYEESGSPAVRPADFQEINLIPEQGVSLGGSNPLLMDFRGSSYTGSGAILDESGNGKEMTGNAIWTSGTKYFQFNSSTPTVNETTNPLGASRSTPFTMEAWAARGTSASWQTIMTITNSWTQMAFDSAGQIRCGRNGGGGGINASTSFTANVDQWYHIVMTYDGNDNGTNAFITIYVDGVAVTGATDMGVNNFGDNGQYIRLGTHAGGGEYLNGRIGEVRVYDRELTANEVLNNYLGSKDRYHGGGNGGSGLVINDGNLWADSSSKKNDALIGITQFQPTYNNTYFTYNGNTTSGDYVRLPNLVHDHVTEPDWSYEIWFRTSSGHGTLFGQQMNPFPNVTTGWVPALHLNSDGTLRAEPFWTTTGSNSADVTSGTNYRDGNWHHVVVTRENDVQRMYIDGSLETTGSSHTPSGYHTVYYYFVGAGKISANRAGAVDGQAFFNGDIGDFRFYKRPLTAAQAFQNYNATKSKYINEAPDTAPKVGPDIVYGSNLVLNYDFGNRATYDAAQNLIRNSTDATSFGGYQRTITNNAALAPDGTMTAAKIAFNDTSGGTDAVYYLDEVTNIPANNAGTYTYSVWLRGPDGFTGGARIALLQQIGDNTEISVDLTDEWQQYTVTKTYDGTFSTNIRIHPVIFRNFPGSIDVGKLVPEFVYLWHPQLEKSSTTGRHVPTYGSMIQAPTTVKNLSSSYNTATITSGKFDDDGYFEDDASNFLISAPINTGLSGGTMEAWIWFDNVNQNQGMVQIGPGGAGPYVNFYSPGATSQKMRWEVIADTANGYTTILSNNNLVTGQWYHFVGIFDGASTTALYVNGNLDVQQTNMSNQPANLSNTAIQIGNYAGVLDGRIGEVRFYNRDLSATEVSQNFNATRAKYGV